MHGSGNDPESLEQNRPHLIEHKNHFDVSHWHFNLHPRVIKECARNALPKWIGHFFHPTHAFLTKHNGEQQAWTSRDHRKHRHVDVSPSSKLVRHADTFWARVYRMRRIEYWNISWWVAQAFTWGSVIWVVNGFATFLPFCNSHFQEAPNTVGWTAFIGATVFEVGSIFGILEAWNRDDTARFGWSMNNAFHHHPGEIIVGKHVENISGDRVDIHAKEVKYSLSDKKYIWFSAKGRYWREMGFLAAFFQLLGASIFWISGFTAIPQIYSAIEGNTGLLDGIFWSPQVVGGSGFIISSTFIMLEAQKVWWKPSLTSVGWQVGVWNFIGGVGFTLCGALGYAGSSTGAQYQSSLSTFWGGWAFLIGSVIQWYESVNSL